MYQKPDSPGATICRGYNSKPLAATALSNGIVTSKNEVLLAMNAYVDENPG